LTEATLALGRLDAEALGRLERRAVTLQGSIAAGVNRQVLAEVVAQHRVFAAVMQATGRDLAMLERVALERAGCGKRDVWAR
jgi:hypothetical protein